MGDQWSRVEKRLIELEREWEGGGEKRIKMVERERGMIEKVAEGRADGDSCNSQCLFS